MNKGWIGCDLDGTLARYDGWKGPEHIGDPVPLMAERIRDHLAAGDKVRIVTARVSGNGREANIAYAAIIKWALRHFGNTLTPTATKDFQMVLLYDDRAVTVETNTGRILTPNGWNPA